MNAVIWFFTGSESAPVYMRCFDFFLSVEKLKILIRAATLASIRAATLTLIRAATLALIRAAIYTKMIKLGFQ